MMMAMVIHVYPWLSMVIHSYPWLAMVIHGWNMFKKNMMNVDLLIIRFSQELSRKSDDVLNFLYVSLSHVSTGNSNCFNQRKPTCCLILLG